MDLALRNFLDSHDENFWKYKIKELAHTAHAFMAAHNVGGGNLHERSLDFAHDAIAMTYDACLHDRRSKFDPEKGDPLIPLETKFWNYLKHYCLLPLIKKDIAKWKSNSHVLIVPIADLEIGDELIDGTIEDQAADRILHLVDGADDDLARLISGALSQLEDNPDQIRINWAKLQSDLDMKRYQCDQLRPRLKEHLSRLTEAQAV